jgi:hypothetical protein
MFSTQTAASASDLHPNEIRDYLRRAPKRWSFNGSQMVNNTGARFRWLADLACGTLNKRINRRAGVVNPQQLWQLPPWIASKKRNHRNEMRKHGIRFNPYRR